MKRIITLLLIAACFAGCSGHNDTATMICKNVSVCCKTAVMAKDKGFFCKELQKTEINIAEELFPISVHERTGLMLTW